MKDKKLGRPVTISATEALVVGCSYEMKEKIKEEAAKLGVSTSELVRRLMNRFLKEAITIERNSNR